MTSDLAAVATAAATTGEPRAGGTDLSERRRSGVARGPVNDIAPTSGMTGIAWDGDGAAHLGALTSIGALASDARLAAAYPAFAAAAAGLATPQIRHIATLGGNLAQHTRCAYYRTPHIVCFKKGGSACPAREGHHLTGVAFDGSACVAPHPSTMAAALLAYDAAVATDQRTGVTIEAMLGDGADGTRDHALLPGELIVSVAMPVPIPGERGLYRRAVSRTHAEWPLVEVVARAVVTEGRFAGLRLTAGGIAPRPLRLLAAEQAALGQPAGAATIARAASAAAEGAKPLPQTGYKLDLLRGLVQDLLERLAQ